MKTSAKASAPPVAAAASGFTGSFAPGLGFARWTAAIAAATAAAGGAVTYLQQPARLEGLKVGVNPDEELRSKQYPDWVYKLANSSSEVPMLTSNTLLSEEHPMLKRDHMVCSQSMPSLIDLVVDQDTSSKAIMCSGPTALLMQSMSETSKHMQRLPVSCIGFFM